MFAGKKILALVTARGGSKGLPNKNILPCSGKPLIHYTLEAGTGSRFVDKVVLSTDSPEISKVASAVANVDIPFLRPASLGADDSSIYDVIRHALEAIQGEYDLVALLQPTSPLRTARHLDEAIEKYYGRRTSEDSTLVSVTRAPDKVFWLMREQEGHVDFCFDVNRKDTRRQEARSFFLPNGAVYLAPARGFGGTFYTSKTLFYEMSAEESVDVDSLEDLLAAEKALGKARK